MPVEFVFEADDFLRDECDGVTDFHERGVEGLRVLGGMHGDVAGSGFDGVERQGDAVEILQHGIDLR